MNNKILMLALLLTSCGNNSGSTSTSGNGIRVSAAVRANISRLVNEIADEITRETKIEFTDELKNKVVEMYTSKEELEKDKSEIVDNLKKAITDITNVLSNLPNFTNLDVDKQNKIFSLYFNKQMSIIFKGLTIRDVINLSKIPNGETIPKELENEREKLVKATTEVATIMTSQQFLSEMKEIIN